MVVTAPQHRIVDDVRRRHAAIPGATPFALRHLDGSETVIGDGVPDATLVVTSQTGLDALASFDLATAAGAYLEGEMHGDWAWYRTDGSVMRTGQFDRGRQVGTWRTHDRPGRVVKETAFSEPAK